MFSDVNKLVPQSSLQTSVIKEETTAQNTEDIIPKEKSRTFPKSIKESSQKIPVKVTIGTITDVKAFYKINISKLKSKTFLLLDC